MDGKNLLRTEKLTTGLLRMIEILYQSKINYFSNTPPHTQQTSPAVLW